MCVLPLRERFVMGGIVESEAGGQVGARAGRCTWGPGGELVP